MGWGQMGASRGLCHPLAWPPSSLVPLPHSRFFFLINCFPMNACHGVGKQSAPTHFLICWLGKEGKAFARGCIGQRKPGTQAAESHPLLLQQLDSNGSLHSYCLGSPLESLRQESEFELEANQANHLEQPSPGLPML